MTRRPSRVFLSKISDTAHSFVRVQPIRYNVPSATDSGTAAIRKMDKFVTRQRPPKQPQSDPSKVINTSKGKGKGKESETVLREPPKKRVKREIADSDADSDASLSDEGKLPRIGRQTGRVKREDTADSEAPINDGQSEPETHSGRPTAIESSLPEIETDKDAIQEYETFRASQGENSETVASRFVKREWVKGKSSLYVDAFNLALGTVLEDESHLFDDKERFLFDSWDNLSYEAQYL